MNIVHYDGQRLVFQPTTTGEAGRWAKPPGMPDRCYFCPSDDEAVAYVLLDGYRLGVCASCRPVVGGEDIPHANL